MKIWTVDLDSTLCDTTPRKHLLDQVDRQNTDWHAYAKACGDDLPHKGVIAVMRLMMHGNSNWGVVSGRSEQSRAETEAWIADLMREEDLQPPLFVHLDDSDGGWEEHHGHYKARRIRTLQESGFEVEVHLDDWPAVREIVEAECGVPVLCVTPTFVTQASLATLQ